MCCIIQYWKVKKKKNTGKWLSYLFPYLAAFIPKTQGLLFLPPVRKARNELPTEKQSTNQLDNQSGILFSVEYKDKIHIRILSHGAYFIHDYYRMMEGRVLHFFCCCCCGCCFLGSDIQFQFSESLLCKQKSKLGLLSLRRRVSVEHTQCYRQMLQAIRFLVQLCRS